MDKRIESMGREPESGFWIYLKPGFIVNGEGVHAIVEDTKRLALDKMDLVVPCSCAECSAMANKGFESEQVARERAAADMPNKVVYIIESAGQFYVEPEEEGAFLRSWEREVYHGVGKHATKRLPQHTGTRAMNDIGGQ